MRRLAFMRGLLTVVVFPALAWADDDPAGSALHRGRTSSLESVKALAAQVRQAPPAELPKRDAGALRGVRALADEFRAEEADPRGKNLRQPQADERRDEPAAQNHDRAGRAPNRDRRRDQFVEPPAEPQLGFVLDQFAFAPAFGGFPLGGGLLTPSPFFAPGPFGFATSSTIVFAPGFSGPGGFFFFPQPIIFSFKVGPTIRFDNPLERHWRQMDAAIRRSVETANGAIVAPSANAGTSTSTSTQTPGTGNASAGTTAGTTAAGNKTSPAPHAAANPGPSKVAPPPTEPLPPSKTMHSKAGSGSTSGGAKGSFQRQPSSSAATAPSKPIPREPGGPPAATRPPAATSPPASTPAKPAATGTSSSQGRSLLDSQNKK